MALLVAIVAAVAGTRAVRAQQCGVWIKVPAAGTSMQGITYANGQFVSVGLDGAHTSADGFSWSTAPLGSAGTAARVAFNGALFTAVGDGGKIYTSANGSTWTPRTSPTTLTLAGIAWGNGTWVAVGNHEVILTSPDGIAWTQVSSQATGYLSSVVWASNKFVAVGDGAVVATSPDGAVWDRTTIAGQGWLTDVIWVGGQLVAVSFSGAVLTNSVFTPWTPQANTGRELRRIVWTGSKYVVVGDHGAALESTNLTAWTDVTFDTAPFNGNLTGIAWSGTELVAVGAPAGVYRSDCAVYAEFGFTPASPQRGQNVDFAVTTSQGLGRARWEFGEVGCNGASASPELACLANPCTFPTTFAFASAGEKTISLFGWSGTLDGQGNRVFRLMRTHKLTVAATGSCPACVPPGAATNPVPPNGAIRAGGPVVLEWAAPATGTVPFTYDVELDAATVCAQTGGLQCPTNAAESATPHTWRVIANNACGQTPSELWSFTACGQPGPPEIDFDWLPVGPLACWPLQEQPYVGQDIAFHDLSSRNPSEWAWSGVSAAGLLSEQNPHGTWWAPGDRTVGLQAANCAGWSAEATKTVTVHADVRPRLWAFDFGTGGSPVAAGFTGVVATTAYAPGTGYGWLSGAVEARDRTVGGDLARDFNFSTNATFAVDVANRTYDVAVWLGDMTRAHDEMAVSLEGTQVDVVSTAAGAVLVRVYRVTVADSQLTVRLQDLGGADPNAVIVALEVVPADPVRVDFGTAVSPVAAGFQGKDEGSKLLAPSWCGWLSGKIASRDRASGNDLLRDFDLTQDGTFACALERGVWDVTLTMGDATSAHDQMGVYLEGVLADTVSRSANQFLVKKHRVRIADGQLTLRLRDLGGNDVNTVINALEAVRVGPFDFGTPSSPLAPGHVRVSPGTKYSAASGYGWLAGIVSSRDRAVGSDLHRDFDLTVLATFAVDVPAGSYVVTVVMGDATNAHDQMAISLEGTLVDTVGTAKAKYWTRSYTTTVSDGQLTFTLEDKGGSDPNAVINGLAIAPAP